MFELFKKTSRKIEGKAFAFFDMLFKQLPVEFNFLLTGLHKGLYKRYTVNSAIKGHYYTIGFDPLQSDKSMVKGKHFELQDILVIQDAVLITLTITVYEGLWVGFEIEKNIADFKNFEFDLAKMHKTNGKFAHNNNIEKLVHELSSVSLDLHDLSEFEMEGKLYYQIKDLEDGNYIAIDDQGQVFLLTHDPYKITLLNKSVKQFVDDINKKQFDIKNI